MKQILLFYKNPWIWGTHLFGALIALLAPIDVLSSSPYLTKYVEFAAVVFPPILGYERTSHYSQVSGLYFSVMFPLGAIWFWQGLKSSPAMVLNSNARIWKMPRWVQVIVVVLFGFVFYFGLFYFAIRINPGYDYTILGVTRSRIGLAVWGVVFSLLPWQLLSVYIVSMRFIFKRA